MGVEQIEDYGVFLKMLVAVQAEETTCGSDVSIYSTKPTPVQAAWRTEREEELGNEGDGAADEVE